ncbi:RNA 2',3'-cyclic phosphodiesterase [Psychrobacillus lasiicapitis]|uniref:RNA 2',3'-cyclic phosphodiesterase n=1 Tax=Psychrobacillus lasiicapitis TaxID=1636719 RepID=A0A544T974_9BACI|nr:RNA 2',3'-cyclic phosphodiesterase [Psychrobacillus lasiicapitis]TQR14003.1 RNA 2',3'-cyclic phosphodiesterase [Psychrobacillus lasiicapitis]GGA37347.1 RNA 2',3'-cyclic phosphodiesterase [Psychrobacillus lasiicapitis]
MKQHYFIGIKVPEHIAKVIVNERDNTNVHQTHKTLPVAEDLHITLFYLGHVEPNVLATIAQRLRDIQWEEFKLTTSGLSHFGNAQTPRVIYTAIENSEYLHDLHQQIVQQLSKVIELNNIKEFRAHITIAKKWAETNDLHTKDFQLPKMSFDVSHFSIFQINNNRSPRYEEIVCIQNSGV